MSGARFNPRCHGCQRLTARRIWTRATGIVDFSDGKIQYLSAKAGDRRQRLQFPAVL